MLKIVNQKYTHIEADSSRAKYSYQGTESLPEQIAIRYYENQGYRIIWGENDYWSTILSLLFWDVIFAKVRGAVTVSRSGYTEELDPSYDDNFNQQFNEFIGMNGMPSDMFSGDFARNREDLIKTRYRQLSNIDIHSEISRSYNSNKGKSCRLINDWNKFSVEELQFPISGIPKEQLLRILLRLIENVSQYRSGFPDLIGVKDGCVLFVEVKSEKDKLSHNQVNWISYLALDRKLNVEIFLINHTEKTLVAVSEKFLILLEPIKIIIGKTSSKLMDDMVGRFKKQADYQNGDMPSASFYIYEDDIKEVVKTVGRWNTSRFFIKDKEYSIEQIRNAVYEYYDRQYFDLSNLYFRHNDLEDYGCNKFNMSYTNDMGWADFGYVNPVSGDWVFDKQKITAKVNTELELNALCPYIDSQKIQNDFLKLPERVNPKNDSDWAYIDNERRQWVFHNGKWITDYTDKAFGGVTSVVGVKKLTAGEKRGLIASHKQYAQYSDVDSNIYVTVSPSKKKTSGGGCLGMLVFIVVLVLVL